MKDTVLSISGRPGLFKLVAQGRGMLIIESIEETPKRTTAGGVWLNGYSDHLPVVAYFVNQQK